MVNPGYGSWIDPENPHAPEQIKMIWDNQKIYNTIIRIYSHAWADVLN